ncbi:MAG: 2-phospho-L-lactate/phosphoenolpyruvate guanylyltransferase [Actinomycetota bacterium]|jgi:2-phospho-L-lactate guanylyltransferase|nr:2-phospho-L-lactate/phosphoenolpyruvate guanylyltransferase [Actinomycetota bacterium]
MDPGLLPVKQLSRAKQRLLPHVTDEQRHEIARALLDDALDLCASATRFEWWVVSDDAEVRQIATDRGFNPVEDPGEGLNRALEVGIDTIKGAGGDSVTIIPIDVPLAWTGDLQDLQDTSATSDVVVVPSRDGGTNGLYLSPPDAMKPMFGEFSFKAHIAEAEHLGLRCSMLTLPRLELDIDTIEDVDAYLARPRAAETRTSRLLTRIRS